jgi:hypothetical protein
LFLFGATNRYHDMDKAFLRRIHGKYFVGFMNSENRTNILKGIEGYEFSDKKNAEELKYALHLTTNFSVDNMQKLKSLLISHKKMENVETEKKKIIKDKVLEICKLEGIFFGDSYLPDFYDLKKAILQIPDPGINYLLTGKYLFRLGQKPKIFVEVFQTSTSTIRCVYPIEEEIIHSTQKEEKKNSDFEIPDVIWYSLNFAFEKNLNFVEYINQPALLRNQAFDEISATQFISRAVDQCYEYPYSLIIFDVDSIIGLTYEEDNFGQKIPKMLRSHLFSALCGLSKRATVQKGERALWMFFIVSHPLFVSSQGLLSHLKVTSSSKKSVDEFGISDPKTWNSSQVKKWLSRLGVKQAEEIVEREGIDGKTILEMDVNDWAEIKLPLVQRKKIVREVAELLKAQNKF